jgi:splicing factor 3B subunit 1
LLSTTVGKTGNDNYYNRYIFSLDIEAQIAAIQAKRASQPVDEDIPKENARVGLNETGVFDTEIYGGRGKFEGYVTSIAAKDDDDEDDGIAPDRGGRQRASYTAPLALLNDVAKSNEDYDPFAEHKKPTIASRESEYQARRRLQQISPARVDFFAEGGKTPEVGGRGYAEIMKEQQLRGQEADLRKQMAEKAKEGTLQVVADSNGAAAKVAPKRKGRWDQTTDETPAKTAKKPAAAFFAAEASTPSHTAAWAETPGRRDPGSETPGNATPASRMWDPTPAHATPGRDKAMSGAETPGHGAVTPSASARRNRWDETPRTDRETPAHAGWAETPRTVQPGDKIISETPTPSASKRRSRWDETPGATPSMTPGGATPSGAATPSMTPGGSTPGGGATPSMMTPGGITPMGQKAMAMATPSPSQMLQMTPEQMQAYRWEREIDERNRPLSDEELDAMFPPGYKVLQPPAGYIPIRTPSRKLTATPTPLLGQTPTGFYMQQETLDKSAKFVDNQPKGQNLPFLKPEDAQYFDKLLVDVDEESLSPEELKERTIMKLLLKIKNGTPPMRKSALRRITDKAREFGAGPLFNQILPLLMSPTLEDQERHLLVKVIDRVLYKLDDLVRPYVHKILVVIEPLLIDEDYYARVEGREIISNLAKAAGLATMISTMRPDIDNIDEYVRNTTARAFAVVASALGIPSLLPFLKAVCRSKKSWQARHTGIKIVQQIAILMGCAILPHLRALVEIIEHGLVDEQQKVRTITALALAALAEAATPYGIESFDSVLKPLWKGIRTHRGKGLAAFLKVCFSRLFILVKQLLAF